MADVIKRIWRSGPRKVKRSAWGYTMQKDGKQIRVTRAAWTENDAQTALAAAILERDAAAAPPAPVIRTLGQVAQEYLDFKRGKGKRSIRQDEQIVGKLKRRLGRGHAAPRDHGAADRAVRSRPRLADVASRPERHAVDRQPRAGDPTSHVAPG
jgi:hypothetical protein